MKLSRWLLLAVCLVMGTANAAKMDSHYTPLQGKACRSLDEYTLRCPGVGGYQLNVLDDDNRMSIDVIYPDKKKFELNLWGVVTRGFSHLGKVAEWRVTTVNGKVVPHAMIVRVYQDASEGARARSFLSVIKLTGKTACVTKVINGEIRIANTYARTMADKSAIAPCLPE